MGKIWYVGSQRTKNGHVYFSEDCYKEFVAAVESIPELEWKENLEPKQFDIWKETPQFYKTTAIMDYDFGKVNPYGLRVDYDQKISNVSASPRTISNQRSIEIIFDIAEALNAKVYEGSTQRTKEKYMQRYTEEAKENRKVKNEEKIKAKPEKNSFWGRLFGKKPKI